MTYKQLYQQWIEHCNGEDLTYLKNLNETEIEDVFSKKLEFGTAGLRAIMGQGPGLLNVNTIRRTTQGLANFLKNKYNDSQISVVIAHDCRNNSRLFSNVAAQALIENDITVYQFSELMPTPLLSYMTRELKANAGIMITASHNPKEYNGYKVYDESGAQLNTTQSKAVTKNIEQLDFDFNGFDEKVLDKQNIIKQELIDEYLEKIKTENKNKNLKIIFTPNHGTAYKLGPQILKLSGYTDIIEVKEQTTCDGNFSNTKSANPEEHESFEVAIKYLEENNYDIALATDPDADRIGLVTREDGKIIYYTGNETGSLLIKYLIETNSYTQNSIIYKTIVTGEMGAILARKNNITIEETLTGFKYIGEKIRNEKTKDFIMGYEESYGYLFNDIVRDKDAIQATILIADMVNYYKNQNKNLSEVLNELYDEVGNYTEITYSYKVKDLEINKKVMDKYRNYNEDKIFGLEIESKVDYLNDETGQEKADVIKYFLKDIGWLVFRPSGTEPKIKMYVSFKADSIEESKKIAKQTEKQFNEVLNNL